MSCFPLLVLHRFGGVSEFKHSSAPALVELHLSSVSWFAFIQHDVVDSFLYIGNIWALCQTLDYLCPRVLVNLCHPVADLKFNFCLVALIVNFIINFIYFSYLLFLCDIFVYSFIDILFIIISLFTLFYRYLVNNNYIITLLVNYWSGGTTNFFLLLVS